MFVLKRKKMLRGDLKIKEILEIPIYQLSEVIRV
jgi:hypothetical protein